MVPLHEKTARLLQTSFPDKAAAILADFAGIAADILSTLRDPDFGSLDNDKQADIVLHVVRLYSPIRHSSATEVADATQPIFAKLALSGTLSIDRLAQLYDGIYFLYWCAGHIIDAQRGFATGVVPPFVQAVVATTRPSRTCREVSWAPRIRIAYLAEFCYFGGGNALGQVAISSVKALSTDQRVEVYLYAWRMHNTPFLDAARELGVHVREFADCAATTKVERIAEQLEEDEISVVLTDMNSAIPTMLFVRRVAPVQIYFQLGMPYWPVPQIDIALLGWHLDPHRLGYEPSKCRLVDMAWDLAALDPPVDAKLVADEQSLFPAGKRLIGMYGRLAKVTPEYLEMALRLLNKHPDVVFVIGGEGDARQINEFLQRQAITDRLFVVNRFVDGHVWGHFLDVFLDTWPFQGGYSVREVIAKGMPAVTMKSPDYSNLANERDPQLVVNDVPAYEAAVTRLLVDADWMQERRRHASTIAADMANTDRFASTVTDAVVKFLNEKHGSVTTTDLVSSSGV